MATRTAPKPVAPPGYSQTLWNFRSHAIKAVRRNPGAKAYAFWNALPEKYRFYGYQEVYPMMRLLVIRGWEFGVGIESYGDMRFHKQNRNWA